MMMRDVMRTEEHRQGKAQAAVTRQKKKQENNGRRREKVIDNK